MFKQLQADIKRIWSWFKNATSKLKDLQKSSNPDDLANVPLLTTDIFAVINSFFSATTNILPQDGSITPFPKNIFSQINWIGKNWKLLMFFAALGLDPFKDTKIMAEQVATKWGFTF